MWYIILGFWQFFWVWGTGIVLARPWRDSLPYGYYTAISFALGEVFVSYLYFALGLMGYLRASLLIPLAIVLTLATFRLLARELLILTDRIFPYIRRSPGSALIATAILIFYFLAACTPEREVDSIWYHLGVPLYYITHGGYIQLVPFNMPSHYPMNAHLHYCFSLLVGNEINAKIFNNCHFIPLLILLASVVKRYVSRDWSLFAVAVYLCNLEFRVPMMVNNERAVYFYVFLSTVLLWYALENSRKDIFLFAAVFCGMAMGTKFNGILFGIVPQFIFLLWRAFWWKRPHWRKEIQNVAVYVLIAMALLSPWMIKSYIYTGNPLYPMLGEVFPTKAEFVPAMLSNANNHGLNLLKSKSIGEFLGQIHKNVLWLLFNDYLIFFLGLFSTGLLLFLRRRRWVYPLTFAILAFLLFTLLWGSDIARLFGANNALLVLCITGVAAWLTSNIRHGQWVAAIILTGLFVTFAKERYYFLDSPNIRWFGRPILSKTAHKNWLIERGLFSENLFRMKDWIDHDVPPEDELYGYRTGYLYYLHRKAITSDAHFKEQLDLWLEKSPDYAIQRLRELQVTWLLTNQENWSYQKESIQAAWKEFLHRFLNPVRHEGAIQLYRLLQPGETIPYNKTEDDLIPPP